MRCCLCHAIFSPARGGEQARDNRPLYLWTIALPVISFLILLVTNLSLFVLLLLLLHCSSSICFVFFFFSFCLPFFPSLVLVSLSNYLLNLINKQRKGAEYKSDKAFLLSSINRNRNSSISKHYNRLLQSLCLSLSPVRRHPQTTLSLATQGKADTAGPLLSQSQLSRTANERSQNAERSADFPKTKSARNAIFSRKYHRDHAIHVYRHTNTHSINLPSKRLVDKSF